jgi:hypothetical protein
MPTNFYTRKHPQRLDVGDFPRYKHQQLCIQSEQEKQVFVELRQNALEPASSWYYKRA